jgi:hypothetical protein
MFQLFLHKQRQQIGGAGLLPCTFQGFTGLMFDKSIAKGMRLFFAWVFFDGE